MVATGQKATHVVTRFAGHLSDLELTQALAKLQSLKSHPRDEAANRHVLNWAERVFRELSLPERQALEELLHGFESALEETGPELDRLLPRCAGGIPHATLR